jgi:hypothetical protein
MRVRAYVDDARWSFAVSLNPDHSPSQIVQAGLVRLIENHHSGSANGREGAVLATRRRLGELAERVYSSGYQAGLLLCATLDWAQLDSLAGDGWQQTAFESISLTGNVGVAMEDPNAHTTLYRAGFRDALANVWRGTRTAVEGPETTSAGHQQGDEKGRPGIRGPGGPNARSL